MRMPKFFPSSTLSELQTVLSTYKISMSSTSFNKGRWSISLTKETNIVSASRQTIWEAVNTALALLEAAEQAASREECAHESPLAETSS
jgi:hypothetical protein